MTLKTKMISTQEDVQMDNSCLNELTYLYPMHMWLASDPSVLS